MRRIWVGLMAASVAVGVGMRWLGLPWLRLLATRLIATPGVVPPFQIGKPPTSPFEWLEFDDSNVLHFYPPKVELGQGSHTIQAQLLAEELDLDWNSIVVHQPDTDRGWSLALNLTGGSSTAATTQQAIRQMAAELRQQLIAEAARVFNCSIEEVVTEQSFCYYRSDPIQRRLYSELFKSARLNWSPTASLAVLKSPEQFQVIGQSRVRVDLPNKVTGQAIYGWDVRLPDMFYGAVARPPSFQARIIRVGQISAVEQMAGVVKVVVEPDFVGVVAKRRRQARIALDALDIEWTNGSRLDEGQLEQKLTIPRRGGAVMQNKGRFAKVWAGSNSLQAEYRTHMCAPLPFEPPVATVDVKPHQVTVYGSNQGTMFVRSQVAKALKIPARSVRVVITEVGGSFARKHGYWAEPAAEAARLSRAVGQPVQVGWTMNEDLRYGLRRPPTRSQLRAGLDEHGYIHSIEHYLASSDGAATFPPLAYITRITGLDVSSALGAQLLYSNIPNSRLVYHHVKLPLLTGSFRAPGLTSNVFASEGFMDELAFAAKLDPLEFRLRHLGTDPLNRRLRRVLETARDTAEWQQPLPEGLGRGVAAYAYGQTVAAQVAEVRITNNQIRVERIVNVVDAGRLVNPAITRSQVEGATVMGLSWGLYEHSRVKDGAITNGSLNEYKLLPPSEVPAIKVHFIESEEWYIGANEIGAGLVMAAVANAVFDLTGKRLRTLPLQPLPLV